MAFTRHGHQIPGTTIDEMYPPTVARCGGLALCKSCQEDAASGMNEGTEMVPRDLQEKAKKILINYVNSYYSDPLNPPEFEVYVVWFVKVLQHWKAMMATDIPDGKYYELTHNGDEKETYVDEYVKVKNTAVPDER